MSHEEWVEDEVYDADEDQSVTRNNLFLASCRNIDVSRTEYQT